MIREICDVCKKNDANVKYKIKKSRKGMYVRGSNCIKWVGDIWQPWERIMICDECAEKLFGTKSNKCGAPDPQNVEYAIHNIIQKNREEVHNESNR